MSKLHQGWVIDPLDTIVMVPCKASGSLSPKLVKYLFQRFPEANVVFVTSEASLIEMRNATIRDIVFGVFPQRNHFLWMDDDLHPDERTDAMFKVEADVVGCQFVARNPGCWLMPDDVHLSAMRFHRKVVEKMAKPYYKFEYTADMTTCTGCECRWFRDQAKALGFTIARAGFAEHGNQGRWHG